MAARYLPFVPGTHTLLIHDRHRFLLTCGRYGIGKCICMKQEQGKQEPLKAENALEWFSYQNQERK